MKRFAIILAGLLVLTSTVMAAEPTARKVMGMAAAQAKAENKNIMVIFTASWCGWCKRLDAFLADKEMGKLITDNYVVVHLDVLEQPAKETLENEGGEELMKRWGGEKAGLPFTVILDAQRRKLKDSNEKGKTANIGYPAAPNEIAHFMTMLKTAPRLTDSDRTKIEVWLKEHAPKG